MMQKVKNEDGAALVLAMMVLLVLSILGAMLGTLTVGSYRLSTNNQEYNSAYYIAEAGANMAYEEMKDYVPNAYKDSESASLFFNQMTKPLGSENDKNETKYNSFEFQSGSTPTATVAVLKQASDMDSLTNKYIIKSTGEVAGKTRIVEKVVEVTWKSKESVGGVPDFPKDSAPAIIMVNPGSNLFLRNNSEVEGDLFHNLKNIDYGPGQDKKKDILTGEEYGSESFDSPALKSYMQYMFSHLDLLNTNDYFIVEGDITIKQNINKNLIVKGNLIIDGKAKISGNIIVEGEIQMRNHTSVLGSIMSGGNVTLDNQTKVTYDRVTFDSFPFSSPKEVQINLEELITTGPSIEQ